MWADFYNSIDLELSEEARVRLINKNINKVFTIPKLSMLSKLKGWQLKKSGGICGCCGNSNVTDYIGICKKCLEGKIV